MPLPTLLNVDRRLRLLAPIAALWLLAAAPPAQAANVEVGVLTCKVFGGAGFIFGSTKDIECVFEGLSGSREPYYGSIDKFGLDIGFTGQSVIVWTVLAPSSRRSLRRAGRQLRRRVGGGDGGPRRRCQRARRRFEELHRPAAGERAGPAGPQRRPVGVAELKLRPGR